MKYLKLSIGFIVITLVIFVCGANFLHNTVRPSPEIKSLMDEKIDDFHQKLIQDKFKEIYAESDSELKQKYGEQEFIDYLKKAKENFGKELTKANVNSQESLINTIGRKLGRRVFQQEVFKFSEKTNYKSETFRWVIYSNDNIKLVSYDY